MPKSSSKVLPALELLAASMERHRLKAVLIGSAAALLHGAPVKPRDLDFLWKDSSVQRRRLAAVRRELQATLTRPFFHRSLRWRLVSRRHQLAADFVCAIDGFRTPAVVFADAAAHRVGEQRVLVASLAHIVRSKRASGRPQDVAMLVALDAIRP